jgi:hypothetical protein
MSLNIIIDADVSSASQKISKFSYEVQKSFGSINTVLQKTSQGFQYSANQIENSTKSFAKASTNSLTALSLTLQDLPFGFIGIQNNLPGIVQGFGQMSAAAKTGASVMSQLGTALLGPAGLFLAFSAVTSIVTTLSMEYGGLGEAMNAIFGKTNELSGKIKELSESYKEFNKQLKTSQDIVGEEKASTSAQIIELQTLSKIVSNQTKSYDERNAALNRLKEINKDYFGNLTLETLKTNTLTDAVTGYKDSLVEGSITKGFQEQLSKTNVELSKQQILLEKLQDATDAARRAPVTISRATGEIDTQAIKDAESAYNKQLQVVIELKKRKAELNKEVINSVQAQIALRGPVDAANAALEKQKELDKKIAEDKKFAEKSAESFRKFNGRALGQEEAFSRFVVGSTNLQVKAINKLIKERVKLRKESSKEKSAALVPTTLVGGEAFVNLRNIIQLAKDAALAIDAAAIEKTFQDLYNVLSNTFFNPISELFTGFLETGKFAFDDFRKSVSNAITQLVSQIIATGIIQLLATLFSGGFGATAGKAAGTSGFLAGISNVLSGIGKAIGIGKIANPSFGGVGAGPMGMSGQVNLILRGSDLVGSLNRTNATINRVG